MIGRSGQRLVDWIWRHGGILRLTMLVEPTVLALPGLPVADRQAGASGGEIHVLAPSLEGPMRHSASCSWRRPTATSPPGWWT